MIQFIALLVLTSRCEIDVASIIHHHRQQPLSVLAAAGLLLCLLEFILLVFPIGVVTDRQGLGGRGEEVHPSSPCARRVVLQGPA